VMDWPPEPPVILTEQQSEDLGEYIERDAQRLDDLGFTRFVAERRKQSDFHPGVKDLPHKAARFLDHLRKRGANVTLATPPWDEERMDKMMERGPHQSAEKHVEFLREELLDFVKKGFWTILPYRLLKKHKKLLRSLRISPMGVVPQRDRRPRIIVDYSEYGINAETVKMAPREAMQFGKALERILQAIVDADPTFGPVQMIKVDIADGFYRVWLNVDDIPKLAVALPALHGEEPLVALPLVLPMGWTESPPYFCGATETVADITNRRLANHWQPPPHRLEALANTKATTLDDTPPVARATSLTTAINPARPTNRRTRKRPLKKVDVFVDDFLGLGQGDATTLSQIRRTLLHTLDEVFRPLEPTDDAFRKEPASVKKLQGGDAYWATRKMLLGWIIDTLRLTLELPLHRKERLLAILDEILPTQRRVSVKKWQQVLGELRSMAIALPGSKGLFSLLQEALRHQSDSRIRLSQGVHDTLKDLRWLAQDLASRPTRLYEIVPQPEPELLGAQDASGNGMGGVWFPTTTKLHERPIASSSAAETSTVESLGPLLWRAHFDPAIVKKLVSSSNPKGTVTNSDLELAAAFVQHDIAAQAYDIRERTIASGADNTPTVAWQTKGSTTTTSAPAYLLRLQALHQRFHRYYSSAFFVPGKLNAMADDCSRLWHLSDLELLTHFDRTYPQTASWRLVHPTPELLSSVTCALHRRRPELASFLQEPMPTTTLGSSGPASATISWSTRGLRTTASMQSFSYKSLPSATAQAKLPPVNGLSSLALWKAPSVPWVRPLRAWGPQTLA
jgi:hypothetical protein